MWILCVCVRVCVCVCVCVCVTECVGFMSLFSDGPLFRDIRSHYCPRCANRVGSHYTVSLHTHHIHTVCTQVHYTVSLHTHHIERHPTCRMHHALYAPCTLILHTHY